MAFFSTIGGHWVIFQSVAWANMFCDYTRASKAVSTQTIKRAAIKTFDGKHPCQMCKKIAKAQSKEKSKTIVVGFKTSSFPRPTMIELPILVPQENTPISMNRKHGAVILRMSPPTKPPQTA